jgi:deoxyribonuclease V
VDGSYQWPQTAEALAAEQQRIALLAPPPWRPGPRLLVAGCFLAWLPGEAGPGRAGDRAWAAAAVLDGPALIDHAVVPARAGAPYQPGLLALREGPGLEAAVRALAVCPDVVLVDATGRDHPRRAGLALHLGAVVELPTVGVTHRPLHASGREPGPHRGDSSPVTLSGEDVGRWVRTRAGARPVVAHAGWRTDATIAAEVVLAATGRARTAEPLRRARMLARTARATAVPPELRPRS